ncbi:response regulator [Gemmatimonadota bacterium]
MNNQATKILIVDDNPYFSQAVSNVLVEFGYKVAVEHSALSVMTSISKEKPDLILLDLRMPKVGGREVIKTLIRKGIETPIVVVSGFLSEEDFLFFRKQGVKHFLAKPLDTETLLAKIQEVLGGEMATSVNGS